MDRTEKSKGFVEHCPGCGYTENPPENRFCGYCGVSLERALARWGGELTPRTEDRITLRKRLLPGGLGPVGKTVAVSLAAVAADVGLAWLRHRLEKTDRPSYDVGRMWREESGGGPEYLHGYFVKEAALMLREGGETRRFYSSELTIRSSHVEKYRD